MTPIEQLNARIAALEHAQSQTTQVLTSYLASLKTLAERLESLRVVVDGITGRLAVSVKVPSEPVN